MATNIPPHNLGEVAEGITHLIDNPDCAIKDLMKRVKGPDFPTGGIICGKEGIKKAYETGRGRLLVHAKASVEDQRGGKEKIVITEIPYQVNKSNLISSIADLVQDRKIEGISNLRDESDKDGMRIVVELKRGQNAQVILNQLYKRTQMQTTYGVIMLALVHNRPRILDLKEMLSYYVDHRKEIIVRRTRFDKEKAEARAHILEGLKIALKNLDRIIALIKKSKDPQAAKAELMKRFKLSDKQAQAILEMQLQRLTNLERDKIDKEYKELIKKIEMLGSILASEKKVLGIIKEELAELSKKFGDERRTQLMAEAEELEMEDLIQQEDMVITISHSGYIKRLPVSSYRKQRRGGRGVSGAGMREEDFIEDLFIASTHDTLLFFTDKGKAYVVKVYDIPQAGRTAKGKAVVNMLSISSGEKITSSIPVKKFDEGKFLMMVTATGRVKKTALSAFANIRKSGIIAISLSKDDSLIAAKLTSGKEEIFIATKEGKAVRFSEKDIRDMGRGAQGVRGIRLSKKDTVIGMEVVRDKKATLLSVTENGYSKRTEAEDYHIQSRGGKGVINLKVTAKNGPVVGLNLVSDKDEMMFITAKGMVVRCSVKDIRTTGRSAQGVRIIRLDKGDKVASVERVVKEE
jgi:DNA gyrase subunit A